MTPTPTRANSKKKIRESLSLVVNAIPLEARAPKRVLNSFGKRVFVSLFSRVSLSRSRVVQRPQHDDAQTQNSTAPKPLFESTKVSKAVTKSRYLQNDENDALGRGYKGVRSTRGVRSSKMAATSSRDESVLLSRVFCARARLFYKEREGLASSKSLSNIFLSFSI